MAVCHAVVVTDENPSIQHQSPDRTPWVVIPQEQMRIYRDLHSNSTGCVAAEAAIVQGVLGAQVIVTGDGWTGPELREARGRFMSMCRLVIEHLHTFGFVIIAVDPVSRLPGVVDPELVQVWHSCTLDGISHYLLVPTLQGRGMAVDTRPLDGVAVFEIRRPSRNGDLNSPLRAALRNFNYTTMLMQAGLQAAVHNARPMVFLQRERKELTVEEKLATGERGAFGVTERLVAGADATAALLEDERITRAIGTHEIERNARYIGGIFVNGTARDQLSGGMVFGTTNEPNLYDRLHDNETVAAGPMAQAPEDLSASIRRAEDDIARITQVPPTLWGGSSETGVVAQTTLLHTYLQCLATWRTILGTILDDVCEVCRDGVDTRILCNRATGERKVLEDIREAAGTGILPRGTPHDARSSLLPPERRRQKVSFIDNSDQGSTHERIRAIADDILHQNMTSKRGGAEKRKGVKRARSGKAEAGAARASKSTRKAEERIEAEHVPAVDVTLEDVIATAEKAAGTAPGDEGKKEGVKEEEDDDDDSQGPMPVVTSVGLRRGHLAIRFGSAMDSFAIEQMYEQGRLDFDMSQIMLAHLRGLDRADLTDERLDPMTQRPVAELAREQQKREDAQLRAKGATIAPKIAGPAGATKKKTTVPQTGRDDLVRTPGRVHGLGDQGPSVRQTLTRRGPGESKT